MSKTKTALAKIWSAVTWVIVVLAILLALLLIGTRLIGITPYAVLSGSMEPTYMTGSLIYVKKVDCSTLTVGDPITFMLNEKTVATHRIIEIIPDENDPTVFRFFTKGDANENPDGSSVHSNNVIGKPIFTIPYLGYVSNFISNPPGMYLAIGAGAILIILVFLPDLFKEEEDKDDVRGKHEKVD